MPNARRNRDRRPGRRPPFRDPKPTVLIVCEGDVTEPEYFLGFRSACRNTRVKIRIADTHGVPMTLVETAKGYKSEAEEEAAREKDDNLAYDSVWCVFDIDEHPHVPEARQMARDSGIYLAVSNPCFELWLLLHFRDNPGQAHSICRLLHRIRAGGKACRTNGSSRGRRWRVWSQSDDGRLQAHGTHSRRHHEVVSRRIDPSERMFCVSNTTPLLRHRRFAGRRGAVRRAEFGRLR